MPVFAETVDAEERERFAGGCDGELPARAARASARAAPRRSRETIETSAITVSGCRPGHPVLVRISYHPRWKATTGEKVWLAAPSFMLVFPKGERVELVFDGGPPVSVRARLTTVGGGFCSSARSFRSAAVSVRLAALAAARPSVHAQPARAITALVATDGGRGQCALAAASSALR